MNKFKKSYIIAIIALLLSSCDYTPDPDKMRDAAGNTYKAVTIGNQIWMAENLAAWYTNTPNSSTLLTNAIAADFWYPNDDPETMATYGLLYSFNAARALLPRGGGWRIPTLTDFNKLLNELDVSLENGSEAVVKALNIKTYPGSNEEELTSINKYFSLMLADRSTSIELEHQTLRIHANDFSDDEIFRRVIYRYNVSKDFAGSVRFVKDVD